MTINMHLRALFRSELFLRILFIALTFVLVLVAFYPVFVGRFLIHDDYYFSVFFWLREPTQCLEYPQFSYLFYEIGKPLGALHLCGVWNFIRSLDDARAVRLFAAGQVVVLCFVCFLWLRRFLIPAFPAFLLAALASTLPPFQSHVAMISNSHQTFAAILAALAVFPIEHMVRHKMNRFKAAFYFLISALLLMASLVTHQAQAMFFWVMWALPLGSPEIDWSGIKSRIRGALIVSLPVFSFYMAYVAILSKSVNRSLTPNLEAKYADLLLWTGPSLGPLWRPYKSAGYFVVGGLIIALAAVHYAHRHRNWKEAVSRICLFILIVLGVISALIAIPGTVNAHRTLLPVAILYYGLVFFSLASLINSLWPKCRKYTLSGLLIIALPFAVLTPRHYLRTDVVETNEIELNYIRDVIGRNDLKGVEHIHFVPMASVGQKTVKGSIRGRSHESEFGASPTSAPQDISSIVGMLLAETGYEKSYDISPYQLTISIGAPWDYFHFKRKTLLIDMNKMKEANTAELSGYFGESEIIDPSIWKPKKPELKTPDFVYEISHIP